MTDRQIKSIRTKIDRIKKALAADKRFWGGEYHDGRGLRYLPPQHFLKLQDYSGALRYFNWFHKNFPDDCGYPDFLFEWSITLFYCGKYADAGKKAFATYFGNAYYFDKYFNKPITRPDKLHGSHWEHPEMTERFAYSSSQAQFADFSAWLEQFINSDNFRQTINVYNEIERQLENTPVGPERSELVRRLYLMKENT